MIWHERPFKKTPTDENEVLVRDDQGRELTAYFDQDDQLWRCRDWTSHLIPIPQAWAECEKRNDKGGFNVTTAELIERLKELSDAVTKGPDAMRREFKRSIPVYPERDAYLVLTEAARRLEELEKKLSDLVDDDFVDDDFVDDDFI